MKNKKIKFMVPEITPNSSFQDLTLSLLYSFEETEQKIVEDILTARENALKEQISKYEHIVVDTMLKKEGGFSVKVENKDEDLVQSRVVVYDEKMKEKCDVLEEEVESLKEKCEELTRIKGEFEEKMKGKCDVFDKEGELKRRILEEEVESLKKKCEFLTHIVVEFEEKMKERCGMEKEGELKRKVLEEEVESLREKCEELKKGSDLKREMEDERKLQLEMLENQYDELQKGFKKELEKVRECHNEEMGRNDGIMEKEGSSCVFEKLQVEKELEKSVMQNEEGRKELEGNLEKARESYKKELRREIGIAAISELKVESLMQSRVEFEEKMKEKCSVLAKEWELKNKVLQEEVENWKEKCEELGRNYDMMKKRENRMEELEGENRELRKKILLSNETLGKEFAMVEARLAKLKGVFCGRSAETDRASGNDHYGRVVPMSDSHYKVKTNRSFLEYEAGDGDCSENNINRKRKRSIDDTEDDKDSTAFNKNIEGLLKSGRKKTSCSVEFFRKVDIDAPGDSKANPRYQFSSMFIRQCKDENARHQNSELHLTTPFRDVVDESNRYSRGNPHEAAPANKAVAGFQSDKEIIWKHKADMLSAFLNNPELCLASVCALYRQTISANIKNNSYGFRSSDSVRGTAIAKYLINNDPENKLSRSLLEVQHNRKNLLRSCQILANQYGEELFTIYHQEFDPFFCPTA